MKVIITEEVKNTIKEIVLEEIIKEDLRQSPEQVLNKLKKYAATGLLSLAMLSSIAYQYNLSGEQVEEVKQTIENVKQAEPKWVMVADDAIGTIYHSVPAQCKADCSTTANNFRLNLKNPGAHRIVAIERTMEKKWGVRQGDVIKVEGAGDLDGVWQVQDRMNKRFAGLPKIDFLVDYKRKGGKWDNLKVYKLANPKDKIMYSNSFAPQLPKPNKKKK